MGKVRVSVGNLAQRIVILDTEEVFFFGILNRRALEKGRHMIGAVGGAAELTVKGKAILESRFSIDDFEGLDARFVVDEQDLEAVFLIFEALDPEIYEIDARREIEEELATKELPIQNSPILTREELKQIQICYVKTVRQKCSGDPGTSARELAQIPTRRIFNCFDIVVPRVIFEKIRSSPAIRILSVEEIGSTDGGSRRGQTADGLMEMADNLFW